MCLDFSYSWGFLTIQWCHIMQMILLQDKAKTLYLCMLIFKIKHILLQIGHNLLLNEGLGNHSLTAINWMEQWI